MRCERCERCKSCERCQECEAREARESRAGTVVRLLPWASAEGKPAYLLTDGHGGHLSRRADAVEVTQIEMGHRLIGHSEALLERNAEIGMPELRYLTARLTEALRDSLRIAESRGARTGGGE
ncbi:hypothetical protein GCM10010145_00550 [Streptomyces ruber]|uniref:Uncharacterized protein n=2 Tax=Streptomyces TaxID=1883 RepID=A0A918B9V2_9ACTN|nr:hypothetical protein [Streptomyces ruber]GGQ37386.1 hypothetical protein GCM10010145_00550 [Streptomyces ruber]